MKRFLCRLLALIMVFGTLAPAIEAEAKYEMPTPVNSALATEPGPNPTDTVELKYLNPSKFQVSEGKHKFTNEADSDKLETMTETAQMENGELKTLPAAPEITGWTFVGWYTAPVSYAFWGDTPNTPYSAYEEIPFEYDCDGKPYEDQFVYDGEKDLKDQRTQRLESYWIWLSALGDGKNPDVGNQVQAGDIIPEGVTVLYARYKPTNIEYKLYYQGWNGTDGVLQCTRQYGTPFGRLDMDGWDGYAFEGWYTGPADGDRIDDFYTVPVNGASYYAHWHNSDGTVTHANYKASGYKPVTELSLRDGDVGKGLADLGDTLELPHGQGFKNVTVLVSPSDCGVTDLEWELKDDNSYVIGNDTDTSFGNEIATVEMKRAGSKLEVLVRAAGGIGKTTLTVRTKDGKVCDSVIIDTTGHLFNKVEVTQWGSCSKPKILLYTCGICGKTKQETSYASHNWAWRDIPGTCTTDHVWEHYCKVCGAVDPDESTRYWVRDKAPGHQFETTVTSGCGGTVTTNTCTVCGYTESTVGEGVHNWSSEATVDVRPTCHSAGSQSVKCLDCGAVKPGSSQTIPQDPSLHTWEPWVVVTEPTEIDPGEQTRTCSSCHTVESREIPPTGKPNDPYKIASDVETSVVYIADKVADQDVAAETIRKTIMDLLGSGNRDMLADDIYFASLQSQEISATIQVTPVAAPEDGDDFSSLLDSGATVVYMDIDIFVKAGGQSLGKITQTSNEITFKAALPGNGNSVKVLRAHEGVVDEIPCNVENGSVFFSTSKFSTFAVVVGNIESSPSGGNASSIPGGSSGGSSGSITGGNPGHAEQAHIYSTERYTDVVRSAWYHEGVDYVIRNKLMVGTSDTTFSPNGITTRAEMVQILYRLDGEPAVTESAKFDDVAAGQWYSDAVTWAAANKIVDGYGNGRFGPSDTITREQMAAILYRYAEYKGYDLTKANDLTGYTDAASVSGWAEAAMKWIVAEGIIEGTSTTTLSPSGDSTRAQVATIFMRFGEDAAK